MNKKISLYLMLSLLLSLMLGTISMAATETDQNASLLYELTLIEGTDKGLELDKELTRAEAAAFIVKMIGDKDVVLGKTYVLSAFSDVIGDEWFVPYVAYCYDEGIIDGYPDGTFRANVAVSEKEFLKMALLAVGVEGTDWADIFEAAYDKGLVLDSAYESKVNDDTDFVRGNVVNIITNSLELRVEGTGDTVTSRLVDKGVFSEALAVDKGILKVDVLKSSIESVFAQSAIIVEVKMNEAVDLTLEDVVLEDASGKALVVNGLKITGKVIELEVDSMGDEFYTLTLLQVIDEKGHYQVNLSEAFAGVPEVVESNYFHIASSLDYNI